jgi:hypothetical protein
MRLDNVVASTIGVVALITAVVISWRGRNRRLIADRQPATTAGASALDGIRVVASVMTAGFWSGLLVVGLGGRLVMRLLGATSGDDAQGRITDAGEKVGEITFGGTLGFVIFAGLLIPVASSFVYLVGRRILPQRSWVAGLVFGLFLLATFGVDDPLDPDNVDFEILTPLPLAVLIIALTALLFGTTFTALASRLDERLPAITDSAALTAKSSYLSLIMLLNPLFAFATGAYVVGRSLLRGRLRPAIVSSRGRLAGLVIVAIIAVWSTVMVLQTTTAIL